MSKAKTNEKCKYIAIGYTIIFVCMCLGIYIYRERERESKRERERDFVSYV